MRKYLNTLLVIFIVLLSTGALLWQRLDVEKHATATVGDAVYRRGEIVHADSIQLMTFGGVDIWMDENTDVKLIDGRPGSITINVLQGRILGQGSFTIETREVDTVVAGAVSFVHYSWKDQVEIATIVGSAHLVRNGEQIDLTGRSISTTTLPPYVDEEIVFDPERSSAAEFYEQALQN